MRQPSAQMSDLGIEHETSAGGHCHFSFDLNVLLIVCLAVDQFRRHVVWCLEREKRTLARKLEHVKGQSEQRLRSQQSRGLEGRCDSSPLVLNRAGKQILLAE
jgi:hypothetical protein